MKNLQKYILYSFIGLSIFTACTDDKDEKEEAVAKNAEITFTTTVYTRALTNVVTALEDNDAMSVFITENNAVSSGQQVKTGKVTCKSGVWKGTPAIAMEEGEKAYLYATYPYQAASGTPDAVPVEVGSQTDYLYSGNGVAVSYDKPNVQLTMKHALSILAFNIKNDNYGGEGKLQQITIGGKPVYTSGTLNVSSGVVKGTVSGKYYKTCNVDIQPEGWEENIPDFFCIPFSSSGADVTVTFKIDGDDHSCQLPKQVVTGGMKYIFYLSLTELELTVFPEQTKEISLNVDSDSMSIPGYSLLKIAHSNDFFTLPLLKGNGIMGTVLWGDGQTEEYGGASEHSYGGGQIHIVTVETWGTEEVSLSNLVGISEIDLSEF